jgi:hypothetical protein
VLLFIDLSAEGADMEQIVRIVTDSSRDLPLRLVERPRSQGYPLSCALERRCTRTPRYP